MNENDNLFAPRFTIKDVTIHKKKEFLKDISLSTDI